jgi:hypothetical protein
VNATRVGAALALALALTACQDGVDDMLRDGVDPSVITQLNPPNFDPPDVVIDPLAP